MKKVVDNFELIKERILHFDNVGEDVYHIQILKRRKENPELNTNCKVIKQYIVRSIEEYDTLKDIIIQECEKHNARAYINPNRKSLKKVACELLKLTAERIASGNFLGIENDFYSALGKCGTNYKKLWIIDVDMNGDDLDVSNKYDYLSNFISSLEPNKGDDKIIGSIPTLNGFHLITSHFDVQTFQSTSKEFYDVHKNNPTILYAIKK